jgi:hypothetical protein
LQKTRLSNNEIRIKKEELKNKTTTEVKNKTTFLFFVCGRSRTLGLGSSGFVQIKTTNDIFFSQAGK